jgi:O-6-methylguanine DNA methyltransferase
MNTSLTADRPITLTTRHIHVLPDLALMLTCTPKGLHTITFHHPPVIHSAHPSTLPAFMPITISLLRAYFRGTPTDFTPIPLDITSATPFELDVWAACRTIPWGHTRSYRWIAQQIHKPRSARAVGNALAKNPLPILIPCHRVLRHDGSLGGFTAGLPLKRQLLHLENLHTT